MCEFFLTLGLDLKSAITPASSSSAETTSRDGLECPRRDYRECPTPKTSMTLPRVPNPTDYHECPISETTVKLPVVPNLKDYREPLWSAQPENPNTLTPVNGVPPWIVD